VVSAEIVGMRRWIPPASAEIGCCAESLASTEIDSRRAPEARIVGPSALEAPRRGASELGGVFCDHPPLPLPLEGIGVYKERVNACPTGSTHRRMSERAKSST